MKRNLFYASALLFLAIWPIKLLIAPPVVQAALVPSMDIAQIGTTASKADMPSFDEAYQRHMGVLDVLRK